MISLIICAICAAICAAKAIIEGLRDTVTTQTVGMIVPKDGTFTSLIGSASSASHVYDISKIHKTGLAYLHSLDNLAPSYFPGKRELYLESLDDMIQFDGIGSSDSTFIATFNNKTNKLAFLSVQFQYVDENHFQASHTIVTGNFTLPSSFELFAVTKKNAYRTEVTQHIHEIKPNITDKAVVNALAMLLGPVVGGLADAPNDFVDDLKDISDSNPDYAKGKSMFTP